MTLLSKNQADRHPEEKPQEDQSNLAPALRRLCDQDRPQTGSTSKKTQTRRRSSTSRNPAPASTQT